uniref:Uncharacterized protein n=1 Tax=Romanomermis culicivorax TaxID=13658 RepID=A0A915J609_ROMCU
MDEWRKYSHDPSTVFVRQRLLGDDFTNLIHLDKCLQNRYSYCFCMDEGILIAASMAAIGVTLIFSMSGIRKLFSCACSKPKTLDNELQPSPMMTGDHPRNFTVWHLPHGCGYFMFSIALWILWLVLGWVYYARIVVNWPFRLQILDTEKNPAFFDFYKLPRQWNFIITDCFVIATVVLVDGAFQFTLSRPSADYESTSTTEADKQASSDPSQKSG